MKNVIIGSLLRLYIRSLGIKIKEAETNEELTEVYAFREKVQKAEGYGSKKGYPDEYDAHSFKIVAYKGKKLIGSLRLTDVSKGALGHDLCNPKMPAEVPINKILEYGGLVVDKQFRKSNSAVFIALTEYAYRFSLKNGFSHWYGFTNPKQLRHFSKLNPHIDILETKELTHEAVEKRKRDTAYFDKYGNALRPFLADLNKADYALSILLILKKLVKRKKSAKPYEDRQGAYAQVTSRPQV